jgi:AcrR family transcriptional regulator
MKTTKKDVRVKAEILRAAEAAFQQWGITKTTMEDIARRAGKGKSTLYYYFKSKDEVLDCMAEARLDRIINLAREEIAGKTTAKEQLLAYIGTMFREIQKTIAPLHIERDMATVRGIVNRVVRRFDVRNEKAIEASLRFGFKRREFRSLGPRDLKDTTRAIAAVIRSLAFNLFVDNRDARQVDLVIRLLSEGL